MSTTSEREIIPQAQEGRSCCLALAANGAMKGIVILSLPFVLLGEVHQTTGISKRQRKAVSNLCHPSPSSCSVPCCYPVYTVQESIGSKKSTPKHGHRSAFCGLGHTATNLLPAHPSHTHGPTQQAKLLAMPPQDCERNHPVPSHREEKTQDNLQDRSTTQGDIGVSHNVQTCFMRHQQQAAGSGKAAPFHLAGQKIQAPGSWKGGGSQDTEVGSSDILWSRCPPPGPISSPRATGVSP